NDAELKKVVADAAFKEIITSDFPKAQVDWSDLDWRRYNRLILETVCPEVLRSVRRLATENAVQSASESILTYLSEADIFGESGLMRRLSDGKTSPRTATCVAYVHPRPEVQELDSVGDRWRREEERVELVKIPEDLFGKLLKGSETFATKVREELRARTE